MHPIIKLLNERGVSSLAEHSVKVRWSNVHEGKFTANYDQIEAVDSDPIAQECRGLILQQLSGDKGGPGEYKVVAQPFRRFFNHGQGTAADLDWSTVRFEEKLDGTLCIAYESPMGDGWCVATRSVSDADVPCSDGKTFAEKFWNVMLRDDHQTEFELLKVLKGHTLLFELTGPDNQIVLPYDESKLTLLGAIETNSGREVPVPENFRVRRPVTYSFATTSEAIEWINDQPGTVLEGLVAVDASNRRVKLKNSQYLAVMKVMTTADSDEGLVSLILNGSVDDAIPWLPPARQERAEKLRRDVSRWAQDLDLFIGTLRCHSDRKTVAVQVKESEYSRWMGTVMDVWSGKSRNSMEHILSRRTPQGSLSPTTVEMVTKEVTKC